MLLGIGDQDKGGFQTRPYNKRTVKIRGYAPLVSISAIWPAYSWAISRTSGMDRGANGLGSARI